MNKKLLSVGLLVVAVITGGLAGVTVAQDYTTQTDLTNSSILVEDLAPGDTVVTDIEFNNTETGTVSLLYESSQTLTFNSNGTNSTVNVTAGEIHDSATVEANASNLNGSSTYWDTAKLNVSFESINGTLTDPKSLNFSVALTGVADSNVTNTSVSLSGGGESGLFSGVGGENTTQTILLFGAVIGGLWLAREREVI